MPETGRRRVDPGAAKGAALAVFGQQNAPGRPGIRGIR
jgi:hypothetical protein